MAPICKAVMVNFKNKEACFRLYDIVFCCALLRIVWAFEPVNSIVVIIVVVKSLYLFSGCIFCFFPILGRKQDYPWIVKVEDY